MIKRLVTTLKSMLGRNGKPSALPPAPPPIRSVDGPDAGTIWRSLPANGASRGTPPPLPTTPIRDPESPPIIVRPQSPTPQGPDPQKPAAPAPREPAPDSREPAAPDPVAELFDSIRSQWNCLGKAQDDAALEQAEGKSLELEEQCRLWREGLAPFSPRPGETRQEYVRQLWRLLGRLRQMGSAREPASYGSALLVWYGLRSLTEQTHPELIRLAEDLAQVAPAASDFHQMPVLGWTLGVLIEAQHIALSELSPAIGKAIGSLLDLLRIDWSTPQSEVAARLDGIRQLLPLFQAIDSSWAWHLSFWQALGLWRSDAEVARSELASQFEILAAGDRITEEQQVVCWWCSARLRFEAAGSDRADIQPQQWTIIRETLKEWQELGLGGSATDEFETLGLFFRALLVAELSSGLRPVKVTLQPALQPRLRELLGLRPWILRRYPVLKRHVKPVLDRFDESGGGTTSDL